MNRTFIAFLFCMGLTFLAACASSAQQNGGDLTEQVWGLTALGGKDLVSGSSILAQFTSDGKVSGSTGCNQYAGTYTVSGNNIQISVPLAATMMACEPQIMAQEQVYLKALGAAETYAIVREELTLTGPEDSNLLSYESHSQDLAGSSWEAIGYNNGKEAVVSVLPDTTITADFGQDGTLSGNAGCNDYNAPYTITGNEITIGPISSTLKACGDQEGVLEQETQYLAALESAATYQIEGTALELRNQDGVLAADFSKK